LVIKSIFINICNFFLARKHIIKLILNTNLAHRKHIFSIHFQQSFSKIHLTEDEIKRKKGIYVINKQGMDKRKEHHKLLAVHTEAI
jgi:hypothetical protein